MRIAFSKPYTSYEGAPTLVAVNPEIFSTRYFTECMACTFCSDQCCSYGVDVSIDNVDQILQLADAIEARTGISRIDWFEPGSVADPEFPTGRYTRTRTRNGACVFLNRQGRGCHLHSLALETGMDYHTIKPLVSTLFPLTFDDGLLHASDEITEGNLICAGRGPTLYEGVRSELLHYFGPEFITELDVLAMRIVAK
jgi:hypothetical protein